jgi:cytochrome c oxidase subunit II
MTRLLPASASAHAPAIDAMLLHVHWMVLGLFVGWAIYFAYVLVRYRSGRQPHAFRQGTRGGIAIFIFAGVVVSEAVLLVGSALPLWFERTATPKPSGEAVVIRVIAQQFAWNVHYPGADGRFGETSLALVSDENPVGLDRSSPFGKDDLVTTGELHLPINRPVIIELSSKDVIHSFGIPAMRVKQDVIPGAGSSVWFTPTMAGQFEIACSQLCGAGHYRMRAVVTVESDDAFRKFLAEEAAEQVRR